MSEIRIKGNLTPRFINLKLGSFIDALANVQHAIDEIKGLSPSYITVSHMNSDSKIEESNWNIDSKTRIQTRSLEEAKQALEGLKDIIESFSDEKATDSMKEVSSRLAEIYLRTCEEFVLHEPSDQLTILGRADQGIRHGYGYVYHDYVNDSSPGVRVGIVRRSVVSDAELNSFRDLVDLIIDKDQIKSVKDSSKEDA